MVESRDLVQQGLRAEALGDNEQRAHRLLAAWLASPKSPEANWHLARVQCEGEWLPVAVAVNRYCNDPNREKYDELRLKVVQSDSLANSVATLRVLAAWCQRNERPAAARVHYAQLLSHPAASASDKSDAVKALDLHPAGSGWITSEELAQRRESVKAMDKAFARWEGRLRALRDQMDGESPRLREKAAGELAQIDDPASLLVLESLLAGSREPFQLETIKRLERFPQYEATVMLARCAVLSSFPNARSAAQVELKKRPLHEYVPLLLGELTAPFKSQFRVGWDAMGRIGYVQSILQEGASSNRLLVTTANTVPFFVGGHQTIDMRLRGPRGGPNYTFQAIKLAKQLEQDEAFQFQLQSAARAAAQREANLAQANAAVQQSNARIYEALETTTAQQLAREPAAWGTWWQSYNEVQAQRPTEFAYQHSSHEYVTMNTTVTEKTGMVSMSCFVQGTLVRTDRGIVPIETILPGDRVLAQDQESGELTFQPVIATTLRPPTKVLRIRAGGEEIVTTLGHPFWVVGRGWRMAKQLSAGQLLHGLGGAIAIESIEPLPQDQPAHNLVVDEFNTYFVGQSALLVHDNEFRRPTTAIVPGLPGSQPAAN